MINRQNESREQKRARILFGKTTPRWGSSYRWLNDEPQDVQDFYADKPPGSIPVRKPATPKPSTAQDGKQRSADPLPTSGPERRPMIGTGLLNTGTPSTPRDSATKDAGTTADSGNSDQSANPLTPPPTVSKIAKPSKESDDDAGIFQTRPVASPTPEQYAIVAQGNETPPETPAENDEQPVRRLTSSDERRDSILNNTPAIFEYRPNPDEKEEHRLHEFHFLGRQAFEEHGDKVEAMAEKHGVDPDLMHAIMYMENARGHKFIGNEIADRVGLSDSQMPMNINPTLWGALVEKDNLLDVDDNIEAATILVKRISERLKNPTPSAIGSVWNHIGRETPNNLGLVVDRVYAEKPWLYDGLTYPPQPIDTENRRRSRHGIPRK